MLSVCHSVVVIQDANEFEFTIDSALWRLIRLALMVKPESITKSTGNHSADLLLLTQNSKLLNAWKAYFADISPVNDARPRIDGVCKDAGVEVLKYLSDTFQAKCDREGRGLIEQGVKQPSEKEWFTFCRKLWNDFEDSKTVDDFKHLLRQSEINIL